MMIIKSDTPLSYLAFLALLGPVVWQDFFSKAILNLDAG